VLYILNHGHSHSRFHSHCPCSRLQWYVCLSPHSTSVSRSQYPLIDEGPFRLVVTDPLGSLPELEIEFINSVISNTVKCGLGSNRRALGFRGWHWGTDGDTTHLIITYGDPSAPQALAELFKIVSCSTQCVDNSVLSTRCTRKKVMEHDLFIHRN
jgi:hypothetical protein